MAAMHSESWAETIHKVTVWFCHRCRDRGRFQSEEALRAHLESHKIRGLLQEGEVHISTTGIEKECREHWYHDYRPPGICLFCNFDAAAENERKASRSSNVRDAMIEAGEAEELVRDKLWEHIGQHLKSLAFLSLRWCEHYGPIF